MAEPLAQRSPKRLTTPGWRLHTQEDDGLECGDAPAASPSLLPEFQEEEGDSDEKKVPWYMQWTSGALICVNAAFLGVCTNAPPDDVNTNSMCQDSEHVFTSMFLVEFIAKTYLLRLAYFHNMANWLDLTLLIFSILDIWILTPIMGTDTRATQMGKGMVLRLFRLVRVLRLFKLLKQRKELLILIEGLGAAFQSMVWVAILLALVIYGASLFVVSVFRDVQTNSDFTFVDVPSAMMTMFTVGTLADWTSIVSPVVQQFPWAGVFFIAFVLLTNFAMLNLVIGVITERTQIVNEKYEKEQSHKRDVQRLKVIESLAGMLFEDSGRTFITRPELYDIVHNHAVGVKIQELIMEVDLPVGFTVGDLHGMLDRGGRGHVNKKDFIQGMAAIMFSTGFQQNCLIQAALASLRTQMKAMLKDAVEQIRMDLASGGAHAQARAQMVFDAPPVAFGTLPPPLFSSVGGGSDAGRAQLSVAEDLLKAAVADRPPPSAWPPTAASSGSPGDELQKLVSEIAAGCASWSALTQGILGSPAVGAPGVVVPPVPRFGLPPPVVPPLLVHEEPAVDGKVPSDEGVRSAGHLVPRLLSKANGRAHSGR